MDTKSILTTAENALVNQVEIPCESSHAKLSSEGEKADQCTNGVCMVTWKPNRFVAA